MARSELTDILLWTNLLVIDEKIGAKQAGSLSQSEIRA